MHKPEIKRRTTAKSAYRGSKPTTTPSTIERYLTPLSGEQPMPNSDTVNHFLHHLTKVKKTSSNQWIAVCPAHNSKGQKLAIAEGNDGRILLKCWARGCSPADIVSAVGLTMSALFPEHLRYGNHAPLHQSQRFIPRTALTTLSEEITIVWLCASNILKGKHISKNDIDRLRSAARRIWNAIDEVTNG